MNRRLVFFLETAPSGFLRKAIAYLKNKLYGMAVNNRVKKLAGLKLLNSRDFLQALKLQHFDLHEKMLLKFKTGYNISCKCIDLGAVYDTNIAEDYQQNKDYLLRPGDIVFDVGSHIGSFAIYAASKGCRVFAFEPHQGNYEALVKNIKLNNFQKRIIALPYGIFNTNGKVSLSISKENTGGSSIKDTGFATPANSEYSIKVKTFAEACKELGVERINFIKMDVEGSEYKIFESLTSEDFNKIEKIVGEYHVHFNNPIDTYKKIYLLLGKHFNEVIHKSPYYFYARKY